MHAIAFASSAAIELRVRRRASLRPGVGRTESAGRVARERHAAEAAHVFERAQFVVQSLAELHPRLHFGLRVRVESLQILRVLLLLGQEALARRHREAQQLVLHAQQRQQTRELRQLLRAEGGLAGKGIQRESRSGRSSRGRGQSGQLCSVGLVAMGRAEEAAHDCRRDRRSRCSSSRNSSSR